MRRKSRVLAFPGTVVSHEVGDSTTGDGPPVGVEPGRKLSYPAQQTPGAKLSHQSLDHEADIWCSAPRSPSGRDDATHEVAAELS